MVQWSAHVTLIFLFFSFTKDSYRRRAERIWCPGFVTGLGSSRAWFPPWASCTLPPWNLDPACPIARIATSVLSATIAIIHYILVFIVADIYLDEMPAGWTLILSHLTLLQGGNAQAAHHFSASCASLKGWGLKRPHMRAI